MASLPAVKVTEGHVLRMLRISGYDMTKATHLLQHLTFPAELDDVIAVLTQIGISADTLTDRMGGSP